jgi:hypothetical protein
VHEQDILDAGGTGSMYNVMVEGTTAAENSEHSQGEDVPRDFERKSIRHWMNLS